MVWRCAMGWALLTLSGCGGDGNGSPDLAMKPPADLAMGCKEDKACSGMTPRCDTKSGLCVACTADDQCPEGAVCKAGACAAGCTVDKGCGDAGVCDVPSGQCKSCQSDNDCPEKAVPRCDTAGHPCGACPPPNDNRPGGGEGGQKNGI